MYYNGNVFIYKKNERSIFKQIVKVFCNNP